MKNETFRKRSETICRSLELGHCAMDAAKACPCALFEEKNVCLCSGENLGPNGEARPIRLTEHVRRSGPASKIGQKDLQEVLSHLPDVNDPRLLVGVSTADDAAVFEVRPGLLLVQTVDVFTPSVDDPYLFGRIAACNSMSDVYAMGGVPATALSIIGFPIHVLPRSAMIEILRGGMDAVKEAGAVPVGGHSFNDDEVKFGLATTGTVERNRVATNTDARPGDVLILTKPIGSGLVTRAHFSGFASQESIATANNVMATLNRFASETMVEFGVRACTDISGFGLLGHLTRMMMESGVSAELDFSAIPLLPDVQAYAERLPATVLPDVTRTYTEHEIFFSPEISDAQKAVLFDPQISGGLLMSIPEQDADAFLMALHARKVPAAAKIGRVTTFSGKRVQIR